MQKIKYNVIFFVAFLLSFFAGLHISFAAPDDYITHFAWGTKLKDIPDWKYPISKDTYDFLFLNKKCFISYSIKDGIGDGEAGEKEIIGFTISFETKNQSPNVLFGEIKRYFLNNYKLDSVLHELLSSSKYFESDRTSIFYSNKLVILSLNDTSVNINVRPIEKNRKELPENFDIETHTGNALNEMYASELCRKAYITFKQKSDVFLSSISIGKSDESDKIIWERFFEIPGEFALKNDCQNVIDVLFVSYRKAIDGDTSTLKQVNSRIEREFNKSSTKNPAMLSGKVEESEAQDIWMQMKTAYTPDSI